MYNVYVEDFMIRDIKYIFHGMTYEELKQLLKENRRLQSFPLVDKPESMVLLGSIQRLQLIQVKNISNVLELINYPQNIPLFIQKIFLSEMGSNHTVIAYS